jgi:hypothetical protein
MDITDPTPLRNARITVVVNPKLNGITVTRKVSFGNVTIKQILHGYTFVLAEAKIKYAFFVDENNDEHGEYVTFEDDKVVRHTYYEHGVDLDVDLTMMTAKEKMYLRLSGRLPDTIRRRKC